MLMEMCMRESGKMIRLMDKESSLTLIMQGMRENGQKTCSMVTVQRLGTTVQLATLVNSTKERRTGKVVLSGKMALFMMGTSLMANFKVMASTSSQTSTSGTTGSFV